MATLVPRVNFSDQAIDLTHDAKKFKIVFVSANIYWGNCQNCQE